MVLTSTHFLRRTATSRSSSLLPSTVTALSWNCWLATSTSSKPRKRSKAKTTSRGSSVVGYSPVHSSGSAVTLS